MGGRFPRSPSGQEIPVFTPTRMVSVTAGTPWVPGDDDRAFAVTAYVGYKINGGTEANIDAGTVRGIAPYCTYTFSINTVIEVQ